MRSSGGCLYLGSWRRNRLKLHVSHF